MKYDNDFEDGYKDATLDVAEGWVESGYSEKDMRHHIFMMVDEGQGYIDGYVFGLAKTGYEFAEEA